MLISQVEYFDMKKTLYFKDLEGKDWFVILDDGSPHDFSKGAILHQKLATPQKGKNAKRNTDGKLCDILPDVKVLRIVPGEKL